MSQAIVIPPYETGRNVAGVARHDYSESWSRSEGTDPTIAESWQGNTGQEIYQERRSQYTWAEESDHPDRPGSYDIVRASGAMWLSYFIPGIPDGVGISDVHLRGSIFGYELYTNAHGDGEALQACPDIALVFTPIQSADYVYGPSSEPSAEIATLVSANAPQTPQYGRLRLDQFQWTYSGGSNANLDPPMQPWALRFDSLIETLVPNSWLTFRVWFDPPDLCVTNAAWFDDWFLYQDGTGFGLQLFSPSMTGPGPPEDRIGARPVLELSLADDISRYDARQTRARHAMVTRSARIRF